MNKENQKAARKRRKDRQRQLIKTGKEAKDLVSSAERQVQEIAGKLVKSEAEVILAHKKLGLATAELAEQRRELKEGVEKLAVNIALLAGLKDELNAANEMIKTMEAGRDEAAKQLGTMKDEAAKQLGTMKSELIDLKQTDRDTKSLRSRLQRKSNEIVGLGTQVRELRAFLDEHHLLNAFNARPSGR